MAKKKKAGNPSSLKTNTRGKSAGSSSSTGSNSSQSSSSKKGLAKGKPRVKGNAECSPTTTKKRSAGSKKQQQQRISGGTRQSEPPYPLYRDVGKAAVSEGFDSIVNLLRGRKNIVVLTGAGISVSCGIPDFRSPKSGLYSTLDFQGLGLTCPEDLFDWEVFQEDPQPFFKFARNLYFPLGSGENTQRVRPSDSHKLLALLEQKKMLLRVYSQNIDGLEQVAGVSPKHMVYAHGSLQWATCIECKRKVTAKEIEPAILKSCVPLCQGPLRGNSRKRPRDNIYDAFMPAAGEGKPLTCGGVLKPGVTFFGEALHDTVRKSLESDRNKVDALIVIGTSLSVAPMSKVIDYMPANIPRILINRTIVHPKATKVDTDETMEDDDDKDFREGYVFDAYLLGFCDDVTRVLAKKLFVPNENSSETYTSKKEEQKQTHCRLLATLRQRDSLKSNHKQSRRGKRFRDLGDSDDDSVELDVHKAEDWDFCKVPDERVVLFPGADPSKGNAFGDDGGEDDNSEVTFREVAHCDGCTKRIVGIIQKCVDCFDYDLCQKCHPKLSKTHYNGEHVFAAEPAAVVDG